MGLYSLGQGPYKQPVTATVDPLGSIWGTPRYIAGLYLIIANAPCNAPGHVDRRFPPKPEEFAPLSLAPVNTFLVFSG